MEQTGIIAAVATFLLGVIGFINKRAKGKIGKAADLGYELIELTVKFKAAAEDKKFTEKEIKELVKEFDDVEKSFRELFPKKVK